MPRQPHAFLCVLARGAALALTAMALCTAATAQVDFPKPGRFKIILPNASDYVAIGAGVAHSCVTRYDGSTLCWGRNAEGQLGIANTEYCGGIPCATRPTLVIESSGAPLTARQVSVGADHNCAVSNQGVTLCWGNNVYGQTGVPALTRVLQPMPVGNALAFSHVSAGVHSSCAIAPSGAHCWGLIGDGSNNGPSWKAAPVPYGWNYQSITVGEQHVCLQTGLWGYNELNCMGINRYGQTSHDPAVDYRIPVPYGTDFGRPVGPASTRSSFSCADRFADGTVVCAGNNGWGQLGDGSRTSSFKPLVVGGTAQLSRVSAGWSHACAIDPQGQAWCWGNGRWGQLGNGASLDSPLPVLVAGGSIKFRAVAAGQLHSCGIAIDNQIYCWGANTSAQIGQGGHYPDWAPNSPVATALPRT